MRRILLFLAVILIILSFTISIQQTHATVLSGWGTATIDGVVNSSEWASAETISFGPTTVGSQTITITFYIMNDATNLYIAAIVSGDDDFSDLDDIRLYFDNDNEGETSLESGDDALWLYGAGGFQDQFGIPAGIVSNDAILGMPNDGVGKGSRQGLDNHFEVSHPLNSGDIICDFALSIGQIVGFMVEFRVDGTFIRRTGELYTNPFTWLDDYQVASAYVYNGQTTDSSGRIRTGFLTSESVYATGSGFPPGIGIDIYITEDLSWTDGMCPADISSDGVNSVLTDGTGSFGPILVWPAPTVVGSYDIFFDVGTPPDGVYNQVRDFVNHVNDPGFTIVSFDTGSAAVGGFYLPKNSFAVLLPYLALIGLVCTVSVILIKGKRRKI